MLGGQCYCWVLQSIKRLSTSTVAAKLRAEQHEGQMWSFYFLTRGWFCFLAVSKHFTDIKKSRTMLHHINFIDINYIFIILFIE